MTRFRSLVPVILISLIPTLLVWLPFFLRLESFWTITLPKDGMATIVANYDGPLYIAVAKSFYDPEILKGINFDVPSEYFAAHFPLYPIFIKLFSFLFGYPYATLVVSALSGIFAVYIFSKFISVYVDRKDVLWITFLFSIFPARWLIVRSVGSPEPLFIALVISTIYFFKREKFLLSGIFGMLAAFTKSPGILLFPALLGTYFSPILKDSIGIKKNIHKISINPAKILTMLLIPLGTLAVFIIYKYQFKDFLAYFHSGDNIHLFFPPFQIFNPSQFWVGTYWLEEVIFVFLLGAIGILNLIKKDPVSAWFAGMFFLTTLFVSHRDIVRYSLPIVPFLFAGYSQYLVKTEFKYAFYLVIIPIYLFSISFISNNVMPIADWGPLL